MYISARIYGPIFARWSVRCLILIITIPTTVGVDNNNNNCNNNENNNNHKHNNFLINLSVLRLTVEFHCMHASWCSGVACNTMNTLTHTCNIYEYICTCISVAINWAKNAACNECENFMMNACILYVCMWEWWCVDEADGQLKNICINGSECEQIFYLKKKKIKKKIWTAKFSVQHNV